MSRKGENIYKRKDGRWEGRYIKGYSESGKTRYTSVYAVSYTEVKAKLNQAKAENRFCFQTPSAFYLFSEIAEKWLQNVKRNCKESTYNKYYNSYHKHIREYLGKYPMEKIGRELIENFLESMLMASESGKTLSRKTMQDICMIAKQIFLFAETNYHIHLQFSLRILKMKSEQKEVKTLSDEEFGVLCSYLIASKDCKKLGVLLCLFTGIRIGELCALRWSDISFAEKSMRISKTVQRIQQLGSSLKKTVLLTSTPKSIKSNRLIPIPNCILQILLPIKKGENTYFLSGTEQCVEPRVMENQFKKYLAECGLQDVCFHTLRHTFATRCIEHGIDPKTTSEILGHSSVNITLNRYVHSSMQMKRDAMNKITLEIDSPSEFWSKSIKKTSNSRFVED